MDNCQMLVMDEVSAETVLYRKIIFLAEIKIICSNYCEKLLITDNNSKETNSSFTVCRGVGNSNQLNY